MKFEKKLSVIVMCYKHKEYITQCVDSILSQKINYDMEVIIRDDGTNDGTYELLLEKYENDSRIKILNSKINFGSKKNFETIENECRGEYIAYMDGDDYLIADNHYQSAIDFLDANKNYVVYSGGYRYLENGVIHPQGGWMQSMNPDAELKDMLIENYVSLGRVYRNIKINLDLIKSEPYPDWAFLFELMKHGKSYCNTSYCCGIYRIHSSGIYSTTSNNSKLEQKEKMREELTNIYNTFQQRVITIIDSFVYNDTIKSKLLNAIDWMKNDGHEILLVSNTMVDKEILKNVKFYLYDSRNQLFQDKYEDLDLVDFWKYLSNGFYVHDLVPVSQKHGLSVMINLFNAIRYAKQQGYTHFQRMEVDDLFGEKSREYIKNVPRICVKENKNGLFYYNENNYPPDISFHYFYCNIDDFLSKVPNISNERDYINYLKKYYNNKKFKIVEVYVHENLKRNGDSSMLIKPGKEMNMDFSDTQWNTETSISSFDPKYGKCTTRIYHLNKYDENTKTHVRTNSYILYTHSYHSDLTTRRIQVERSNGETFDIIHTTYSANGWSWNEIPSDTKSISVYEGEKFLYKEYASDCVSYINSN
jgi:glycosyltransferase involved in cell wall biosynthesis